MPAPLDLHGDEGPPPSRLARRLVQVSAWGASPWVFWGVVLAYAGLIISGAKRFVLWQQITDLWGASPWEAIAQGHFHAPRLLLMQPVLWLAKRGVDQDLAFSLMALACLVGAAWALARCVDATTWRPWRLVTFLGVALPALTMGGRVVPAFAGLALVLLAARRGQTWQVAAGALAGIWLASVSSGTLAVVVAIVVVLMALAVPTLIRGRWAWMALPALGLCAVGLIAVVAAYADKALATFDHNGWQLLTQGSGTVVLAIRERAGSSATVILMLMGFLWSTWWCQRGATSTAALRATRLERAALLIPVWIGLTGYNSFALVIPPALVMTVLWAQRERAQGLVGSQAG
jgi:hypothetical protein